MIHMYLLPCILCQRQQHHNYIYIISYNRIRIVGGKSSEAPYFCTDGGKLLWRNCLLVVHSKIFVECSGFRNGRDIEIFICGVDAAQLLLAHTGGRKAQHAIADRG